MRSLRLYLRLVGVCVRSQMQYKTSFLTDLAGTLFGNAITFLSLAAVFARFGSVGGWRLGEVAFLYGLVEMGFATMDMVFSGYDPGYFSQLVRRGQFDQMLLRPVALPLQVLSSEFTLRRLGRFAQGLIVFLLAVRLAGIHWTVAKLLYLPVVFGSVVAFFGSLFWIGSTTCFWTVEALEAINIFTYGGTEMLAYPMHIYDDWLRYLFTYVIPASLVVYYPALYFLGKPDPFGLPRALSFLAPVAGAAMLLLASAFWRFGVRHYQGTGT